WRVSRLGDGKPAAVETVPAMICNGDAQAMPQFICPFSRDYPHRGPVNQALPDDALYQVGGAVLAVADPGECPSDHSVAVFPGIGLDQPEQARHLTSPAQLLRHLKGDHPARGISDNVNGTGWLNFANFADIGGGEFFD